MLIRKGGADINALNADRRTPLYVATNAGKSNQLSLLTVEKRMIQTTDLSVVLKIKLRK